MYTWSGNGLSMVAGYAPDRCLHAHRMATVTHGPGDGMRLMDRPRLAVRRLLEQEMLRQNRALVAEEIADAILLSQREAGLPADPLQRARAEQARIDAATARRIGKWRY